jgi:superfamily II DNA or RNA helicase/SOS-response transcriptional repressor LexA
MTISRGEDYLVTGDTTDPFLPKLVDAINSATEIDFAVAFIKSTGLELLYDPLYDALCSGARIRILTSDYLNVTDPDALRSLLILREEGADVRVFESDSQSFHMKAYIFFGYKQKNESYGRAFIGSSNISKTALKHGLEWNLRVEESENPTKFRELREKFDLLFNLQQNKCLTQEWIKTYSDKVNNLRQLIFEEPGADEKLPPPIPTQVQTEALEALENTRNEGNQRGLVVLASGMGKTWLAAFDSHAMNAKRVLFVAHREEILTQAENTFVRIHTSTNVGRYSGEKRDLNVDMLFASIQTIGKTKHLIQFPRDYFDYIIVDEFHHAAARTYRQLLAHFIPKFLLGLTATPERTDQSDILALCDNNLVITRDLICGVQAALLCPFHYYGVGDKTVNYANIPWRSGRFDPTSLDSQLATIARAKHILEAWRERKLTRTLAFCVSKKHADYMSEFFSRNGVRAVSVHSESPMRRTAALNLLREGYIDIIFSVDLFNEGVDVPCIDTVLMIRPTESKIIFLQQLGRGLRTSHDTRKDHLVVLDFIGNHISFFKKVEALFNIGNANQNRRQFLKDIQTNSIPLPPGCYVNYDLTAIRFLDKLTQTRVDLQVEVYKSLQLSLGHRPSILEFFRAGGGIEAVRKEYGSWFHFVDNQDDLSEKEKLCFHLNEDFLKDLETTSLTKSFKLVLLEAFLDLDGFAAPPPIDLLARRSFEVMTRRITLHSDLPDIFRVNLKDYDSISSAWQKYWLQNPINAWTGGNTPTQKSWFKINRKNQFEFQNANSDFHSVILDDMIHELCDFRYEQYERRPSLSLVPEQRSNVKNIEIPYFRDLRIACGHFASSEHDENQIEYYSLPPKYGKLNPNRHFIASASGDSMNGGRNPIKNGDLLLLEVITPVNAGSISNQLVAVERNDIAGDDQYLLRYIVKKGPNNYVLEAWNKDYEDIPASEEMRTFARFRSLVDPLDFMIHKQLMRENIPSLFGHAFNRGLWESGHILLKENKDQILLVTLNKQGKIAGHRYHDYFIDESHFHWQSQNSTTPENKRGIAIINHAKDNSRIHLFVRKYKLAGKTAAPFYYCGTLQYQQHKNSAPMSVIWELDTPLSSDLIEQFGTSI